MLYASLALKPGSRGISTDVCVPISRLAGAIAGAQAAIAESGLIAPWWVTWATATSCGHPHHPRRPGPGGSRRSTGRRIVECALALDGTCTGEHGIGIGKQDFLLTEHGEGVAVMRR